MLKDAAISIKSSTKAGLAGGDASSEMKSESQ